MDADAVADEEGSVDKRKEDAAADEPVKEDGVTVTVKEDSSPDEKNEKKTEEEEKKKKKKYPCRFHPGAVVCKVGLSIQDNKSFRRGKYKQLDFFSLYDSQPTYVLLT